MTSPARPIVRLAYLAVAAFVAFAAGQTRAGEIDPLLPPEAFRPVAPCAPIDPFVDRGVEQRSRTDGCEADAPWRLAVRTPRVRPTDTGPARVEVDLDRQVGLQAGFFTGMARLGVAAASDADETRLQARRALIAAHGRVQLGEQFTLDLGLGQDIAAGPRRRATASATYRTPGRHLLFLQLAAEPDRTLVPSVGLRWWLLPGRAALDLSARRSADGEMVEPRLGLRLTGG